jgi:hypothetical protein
MSAVVSVSWVIGCWAKDYERYLLLQGQLKVVLNRLGISNLLGLRPFAYRLEGPLDPNRACHTRSTGVETVFRAKTVRLVRNSGVRGPDLRNRDLRNVRSTVQKESGGAFNDLHRRGKFRLVKQHDETFCMIQDLDYRMVIDVRNVIGTAVFTYQKARQDLEDGYLRL